MDKLHLSFSVAVGPGADNHALPAPPCLRPGSYTSTRVRPGCGCNTKISIKRFASPLLFAESSLCCSFHGNMEPNPGLIQRGVDDHRNSTPLVLFHDGGGTTISYYRLGPMNRAVYGIADPHFLTGRQWASLPQMARIYANLIQSTLKTDRVLLGGWSLGGFIALDVARVLQAETRFHVVGVVMIDSPNPHGHDSTPDHGTRTTVPPRPFFNPRHCYSSATKMLVLRSMKRACKLVDEWTIPDWRSKADGPPPVLLLRCNETVPVSNDRTEAMSVDRWRHLPMLGWEMTGGLVRAVLDIPGHHFSLMWDDHVNPLYSLCFQEWIC